MPILPREKFRCAPFRPSWWLPEGHTQTAFAWFFRRPPVLATTLELIPTPDGDFLRLHTLPGRPGKPVLLVLHGMEGSVASHYSQAMMRRAVRRGWHAVTMEFRGVGPELNHTPRLYHSGSSDDVTTVVEALAERHPGVPLFAIGFSLGANMLGKYLGEHGRTAPVAGASLVSAPFELATGAARADRSLFGMYSRAFLKGLVGRALRKAEQFPELLDPDTIRSCRSLVDFDSKVTAPLHGFASADEYYRLCGCGQFLRAIRVPTLVVAAEDDPLIPPASIPRAVLKRSPWLHPLVSRHGGHLGFVEGPPWRPRYWAEVQSMRFFEALATPASSPKRSNPAP